MEELPPSLTTKQAARRKDYGAPEGSKFTSYWKTRPPCDLNDCIIDVIEMYYDINNERED